MIKLAKPKYSGPKRPIDKEQAYLSGSNIGTTQDSSTLRTSTVAETYTGGHIQVSVARVSGGVLNMVLIVIPEGLTIPSVSTTDGNPPYTPEEHVLWAGTLRISSSSVEQHLLVGKIRSMRKMKNGDRLMFLIRGDGASVGSFSAIVTSFFKQ